MNQKKIFSSLDYILKFIYYLVKLNLYFWAYTIKGGFLFGFFPALVTLININADRDIEEITIDIKKKFSEKYKEIFFKANKIGIIFILISLSLYFNFLVMYKNLVDYSIFNVFAFYTVLILFFGLGIWLFPVIAIKKINILKSVKYSFILSVSYFYYTLLILIFLIFMLYISLKYPSLLLFFFFSVYSHILIMLTNSPIKKII